MTEFSDSYHASYLVAVGINDYDSSQFSPLGNAEADARTVAEVLAAEPYNFEVEILLGKQATRQAVLDRLGGLQTTDPDDRIVFYFAGHGYVLPDNRNNDVGYLACADTVPDNPYGGLEFEQVTKITRFAAAKHISFILDACFSGTVLGLTRGSPIDGATSEYLRHRAYQVLTAGAVEVVSDARSMTGELVRVLREGLPDSPGPLTFSRIGQYVHEAIHNRSNGRQSPVCQYLEGSGKGQMVLFRPKPIEALPADLRADLKDENARLRLRAIGDAERLLDDATHGEAIRAVLEDMQYDDPDRDVRRRAGQALEAAESVITPPTPSVPAPPPAQTTSPQPAPAQQQPQVTQPSAQPAESTREADFRRRATELAEEYESMSGLDEELSELLWMELVETMSSEADMLGLSQQQIDQLDRNHQSIEFLRSNGWLSG